MEEIEETSKKALFEEFKLVHNFMCPEEPLKSWITKDNFINIYRTDWNSLMEVIDKIESLDLFVVINKTDNPKDAQCCSIVKDSISYYPSMDILVRVVTENSRKEATYKTAVKFIKFYNENK